MDMGEGPEGMGEGMGQRGGSGEAKSHLSAWEATVSRRGGDEEAVRTASSPSRDVQPMAAALHARRWAGGAPAERYLL
jgi:hypothetical protein